MTRKHSWTWLPSRFTRFRPATPSASPGVRPPLAVLEQLEDRVLLSTTDGGGNEALIGLLRGQLGLRGEEINFIKQAGGIIAVDKGAPLTPAEIAFLKIEQDFLKIDGAVNKILEDSVVAHKVAGNHEEFLKIKLTDVIITSFADIENQVNKLGDSAGQLLPAVQRIQDDTINFFDPSKLPQSPLILDHKDAVDFMKYEHQLWKIDSLVTRATFDDFHFVKQTDKSSPILYKIDETFQKVDQNLAAMGDGSVFQALTEDLGSYKIDVEGFITSLASPPTVGTVLPTPT